ncbi:RAMP superfamily CRISPR-associated protein [Nocardiopsis sp. LOL_012]|uniref:RAMP superfamily CRISPR-associated protein n=1 Tax=Nocardiopsis sp. LOL_012 TaxID=3345409 RepID=UPI003A8C741D
MTSSPRPGPVVWEIAAHLRLESDTHVGAARNPGDRAVRGDADLHLDRDPRTGRPRVRATTLAGIMRHELAARTGDPDRVRALFGSFGAHRDVPPSTGALDLDDARAVLPEGAAVAVRTGTRVDPATGTVHPGRVWRWEVLPAGTLLTAHLRLRCPSPADEPRLLALLLTAVAALEGHGPGARLGARTGRGFGAVAAVRWTASRHDLSGEDGWLAYHGRTWAQRWAAEPPADAATRLARALDRELRAHGRHPAADLAARTDTGDRRHRAELRLTLAVGERPAPPPGPPPGRAQGDPRPVPLMLGDLPAADRAGEADRAHRHRPVPDGPDGVRTAPLLGDTALYSLLKRIGARLVRDAAERWGAPPERGRDWHAHWWGADTTPAASGPAPSRVRLRSASVLSGGAPLTTTRLTVDALFGDAVDGHLFTADLYCGGTAEAVLDISEPDGAVLGLLTLIVRELATVPFETLGAGTGGGNGRLTATRARVSVRTGGSAHAVDLITALFDPGSGEAATARGWLEALRTALTATGPGEGDR